MTETVGGAVAEFVDAGMIVGAGGVTLHVTEARPPVDKSKPDEGVNGFDSVR